MKRYIESTLEDMPIGKDSSPASDITDNSTVVAGSESLYESVEYTRSLDKAHCFLKDGHVQGIKYHPWDDQPDAICVTTTVLPSMCKDRISH